MLSDIHANARALRAALAQARQGPCDRLVILGDLLTYGPDVEQVLDLVADAETNGRAAVLVGNHDQLYFDLAAGDTSYYRELPEWLRESVDWTRERVDVATMQSRLRWRDELIVSDWLFAHANPFGPRDWRYLRSAEECCAAALPLITRGLRGGVFGHVHRPRLTLISSDGSRVEEESTDALAVAQGRLTTGTVVAVAGSIGQPRGPGPAASMLRIRIASTGATLACEPVDYDVGAHMEALASMSIGETARGELLSFFANRVRP
ncbi:MAG: metallophosphoesterase family protein [Acidimicrobiia bacterium]